MTMERRIAIVLTAVFVAYLYGVLWVPILLIAMYVLARVVWRAYWRARAEQHHAMVEFEETAARADEQHNLVMQGDPRGMYGVSWPQMRAYHRAMRRPAPIVGKEP